MWRGVVRDGARTGGGEAGPTPQPLIQRLSGLPIDTVQGRAISETPGERRPPAVGAVAAAAEEASKSSGGKLRLDPAKDNDVRGADGGNGTPPRGPPKTPKRNKASPPQLSEVRTLLYCRHGRLRILVLLFAISSDVAERPCFVISGACELTVFVFLMCGDGCLLA